MERKLQNDCANAVTSCKGLCERERIPYGQKSSASVASYYRTMTAWLPNSGAWILGRHGVRNEVSAIHDDRIEFGGCKFPEGRNDAQAGPLFLSDESCR